MDDIVVIGAGQAGASLVAKLRKLGFEGKITLIGEEPALPYERPPLSKAYLMGDVGQERLYLRPASFYQENNIEVITGQPVDMIDRGGKEVILGDRRIPYDKLALTTGSIPRKLPAAIGGDLPGVFTVRTLADVDAMEPLFREGKRALVVGGGYIGLEAAAVARKSGMEVTVVEMADRILQRVASPETSDYFRALHTEKGVDIREGTGLQKLVGGDHVTGAVLSHGEELPVDVVIVGIGIAPAIALAEACELVIENGIRTDAQGRTSDEDIWSAGDCASFPYKGGRIRLESVQNAIDQAECVAENMLGAGKEYVPYPWFWSDQYDCKLQIAGLSTGYDRIVTRGSGWATSFWYFKGDQFLAVDSMNDARSYMVGKRLLEMGKNPDPEAIANPETELKTLLKA
ncbi:NAD(P)/FAD-dependent oxidoreductase [Psychromarinibacter halotolerans]|uniref:NAD(P)/FAD-dependent oxidoreductase n=1 Tax=Psychromarinibacter halotolerans TaxID=1775175 RepID=A0ABV7GNG0_9RHOB|nr:FAD-dependent oxidoreductase [Psychromarinibacter halotolerans]MDF0596013.1 FAD-dependent oxidoreductase [Psychromarinibacter halotolerans]